MPGTLPATLANTLAARVASGVAFLDDRVPGWATRIDLDTIDFLNPRRCVLGQLYGEYNEGCTVLGIRPRVDIEMGLDVYDLFADDHGPILTRLWRAVIADRQGTETTAA